MPELRDTIAVAERHLYGPRPLPAEQRQAVVAALDAAAERLRTSVVAGVG